MKIVIHIDDKTTRTYYVNDEVAVAIDTLLKQKDFPYIDVTRTESEDT